MTTERDRCHHFLRPWMFSRRAPCESAEEWPVVLTAPLERAERFITFSVCSCAGKIDSWKDLDYGGVVLAAVPCGRGREKHLERGRSER
jgi:hypothetical protein